MNTIKLNPYGAVLTGRPYGLQVAEELLKKYPSEEVEFDFEGVVALGSSFGEEVLVPFARRQGNALVVANGTSAVRKCLNLISKDFGLTIKYSPE